MWTRGQTVWPVLRQSVHFLKHQQPLFSSKKNPTTSENVCTEMALLTATQNTSTKQKPMISKDSQENYIPASDFGNANLMLPPGRTRKWNEFTPVICWHFVFALLSHVCVGGFVCLFFHSGKCNQSTTFKSAETRFFTPSVESRLKSSIECANLGLNRWRNHSFQPVKVWNFHLTFFDV